MIREVRAGFKVGFTEKVTAAHVREWVADVPDHAEIVPITAERGHQRDPITVLVGLRATWTEGE